MVRRTGPGGVAESRVGILRQQALLKALDVLDELALGAQHLDPALIALLGLGARRAGPGAWETRWSEWWSAEVQDAAGGNPRTMPLVMSQDPCALPHVETAEGLQLVPVPEEFVRLEGHHWAHSEARGSVYRLRAFGSRAEGLLLPDFCQVEAAAVTYIHSGQEQRDSRWLLPGLEKLSQQVSLRKLRLAELIPVIQRSSTISLVLVAGRLRFKDGPQASSFSRPAARRCPFYIEGVDMGARLELCVVPPLRTKSGDPEKVDAEALRELGLELFPLSSGCRLCVRQSGGPQLRLLSSSLEEICGYLAGGWLESLQSAPSTWAPLAVLEARSADLEERLGHVPGRGAFLRSCAARRCGCGGEAVGAELLEDGRKVPLCVACAAFVPGSDTFELKRELAEHTGRPNGELLGSCDSRLDDVLSAGLEESCSWRKDLVPSDCAVMAAGGMLSLKPPAAGWPEEVQAELHRQLRILLGCDEKALRIMHTGPEADTANLLVTFLLLHPAVLNINEDKEERIDPKIPLLWFWNLELELRRMAANQGLRARWTKKEQDSAVPLLLVSDLRRVVLPCTLILLTAKNYDAPAPEEHARGPPAKGAIQGEMSEAIEAVRLRMAEAGPKKEQRVNKEVQRRLSTQARRNTVAEIAATERRPSQDQHLDNLALKYPNLTL
ncbi:unnamed protein product [Effrenium voratum]|uniref:Uncharacterized protein n=1 Tax=Effrenium voratum TaxID=2562239 RepID=A0AA36HUQ5_9DINO|nr:unnamed protein product [Effrenium voratum]